MFRLLPSGGNNSFASSTLHEFSQKTSTTSSNFSQRLPLMSSVQRRNMFASFKAGVSNIPGSADSGACGLMESPAGQTALGTPMLNVLGPVLKHGSVDKFPDPSDHLLLSDATPVDGCEVGMSDRVDSHRSIPINGYAASIVTPPLSGAKPPLPHQSRFRNNVISTAKYTMYTFLPKFLFEQFRRYSNIFFLFVAIMQQIPGVSPTGRFTTAVPLAFILMVSALKEIIEDFKRHVEDRSINRSKVLALRSSPSAPPGSRRAWVELQWADVVVGDFLKIDSGRFFPADMILISSSEPERMCYIETANLDGETNLKVRQAPKDLPTWMESEKLDELRGTVNCELPNRHLYEFNGSICLEQVVKGITSTKTIAVNNDAVLLRGAILKNTDWVYGFVIYTGHESKLMMNSTAPPLKRSTVDKITNKQITMMGIILVVISLISAISSQIWNHGAVDVVWYVPKAKYANFGLDFLTFVILYNNLIPISLQVALEVVRYIQASFINQDMEMYHAETDTHANARTSNLNEELGEVKYIFSDKTGTLTCNIMEFKRCSIGGRMFGHAETGVDPQEIRALLTKKDALAKQIMDFFTLVAVCHTVVPEISASECDEEITYQAASPDEGALVKGAAHLGFVFTRRKPAECAIEIFGEPRIYQILNVIDFTSARKRMSIVVRAPDGRILIMCKGADTMIYERLSANNDPHLTATVLEHLEVFASDGLRTLCLAAAEVSPAFYEEWRVQFEEASSAIHQREERVAEVANRIEQNLMLYGASAIEDRLQDGVPDTIADLLRANIKVWVLTGDKQETAINIGYSTRLLSAEMELVVVNEATLDNTRACVSKHLNERRAQLAAPENQLGLIIDGKSLKHALDASVLLEFVELALAVKCVICCRVSPMQKAEIVQMVRTQRPHTVTLAIGDGANDVAMIQAAHVGVGISGMEGLQAACSSDYSIAQFRFLRRLLFVHGAWNHNRLCKLILYSFHKNVCLYVIEMWFAIYSGWSGQTLFERWTIAMYNVIFTALPPLAIGLFDRTCSAETRMAFPELYRPDQSEVSLNRKTFWVWIIDSVYHSLVLYFMTMFLIDQDVAWSHGRDGGYLVMGNICYTYVVVTVSLKAGLTINAWSWPVHAAIWGSILLWFLSLVTYANVWPYLPVGAEMAGIDRMVLSSGLFWFGLILIPITALLLDLVFEIVRRTLFKTLAMSIRESEIENEEPIPLPNAKLRTARYPRYGATE
ncbi:probable phospholipid-transporting ATPase IA isoform X3 [Varroa destructor]|uniref:Phospholipid-transporting ATPase n=1 Tax=Varroa destructor TaxID=109461 RepID=A0A7M7MDI1_VARDE|nr:probable phospholipid-transporting ATPase IA isoform X3 [Varroa destructor]